MVTSDSSTTQAADLAALAAELVNSAEGRAREQVAQRILATFKQSGPAQQQAPTAVATGIAAKRWPESAQHALTEAQVVCESIYALTDLLIANSDSDSFPLLEGIKSSVLRAQAAIGPVIDAALGFTTKEESHV